MPLVNNLLIEFLERFLSTDKSDFMNTCTIRLVHSFMWYMEKSIIMHIMKENLFKKKVTDGL